MILYWRIRHPVLPHTLLKVCDQSHYYPLVSEEQSEAQHVTLLQKQQQQKEQQERKQTPTLSDWNSSFEAKLDIFLYSTWPCQYVDKYNSISSL